MIWKETLRTGVEGSEQLDKPLLLGAAQRVQNGVGKQLSHVVNPLSHQCAEPHVVSALHRFLHGQCAHIDSAKEPERFAVVIFFLAPKEEKKENNKAILIRGTVLAAGESMASFEDEAN